MIPKAKPKLVIDCISPARSAPFSLIFPSTFDLDIKKPPLGGVLLSTSQCFGSESNLY